MNLNKQIKCLYLYELLSGFSLGEGVWVIFLLMRGFSLLEVGIAEGFFHVVSFCCEVPSGMLADLLGRKRTLVCSRLMSGAAALGMLMSTNIFGVCLSLGLCAMEYNLASGTREAITYDSLLQEREAGRYLRVCSNQNLLFRLAQGGGILLSGVALFIGWRWCYRLDVLLGLCGALAALLLREPAVTERQRERPRLGLRQLPRLLARQTKDSLRFLRRTPRAFLCMLAGSAVETGSILCGFFLQQQLTEQGASSYLLGLLLLGVSLGGMAGAKAAVLLAKRISYRQTLALCGAGTALGLLFAAGNGLLLGVAGGFLSAMWSEALATVNDRELNSMIPSDQRATLISIGSMTFSVLMMGASPAAGALGGRYGIGSAYLALAAALLPAVGLLLFLPGRCPVPRCEAEETES